MKIRKLSVSGLRAFSQAEFNFQPDMNLLVGVNGVGKTTILDALRICLSRVIPEITASRSVKQSFELSDIKYGVKTLQVSCDFEFGKKHFNLLINKNSETFIGNDSGDPRNQGIEIQDVDKINPPLKELFSNSKESSTHPLAIYFSTRRSLTIDQKTSSSSTATGQAAAYADAMSGNREFNLRVFTHWYNVQTELANEDRSILTKLEFINQAILSFLTDNFSNPHLIKIDSEVFFRIDKNGYPFDIRQLSDGERSMLSLVIDIARRLIQANPGLKNPIKEGSAIILIDELDLHLHPKWQRSIVQKLCLTFPNCQFIATSHSPQIVTSLSPIKIQLINGDDVEYPDRSLGMDSNWILKYLMEAEERPHEAIQDIERVEALINEGKFEDARKLMGNYKEKGFDLPEWSTFEARIARLEIIGKET